LNCEGTVEREEYTRTQPSLVFCGDCMSYLPASACRMAGSGLCDGCQELDEAFVATFDVSICHCGNAPLVTEVADGFEALCTICIDPTEDAGPRAHVVGHGPTVECALEDWRLRHGGYPC
jgi:hypothetical protein